MNVNVTFNFSISDKDAERIWKVLKIIKPLKIIVFIGIISFYNRFHHYVIYRNSIESLDYDNRRQVFSTDINKNENNSIYDLVDIISIANEISDEWNENNFSYDDGMIFKINYDNEIKRKK